MKLRPHFFLLFALLCFASCLSEAHAETPQKTSASQKKLHSKKIGRSTPKLTDEERRARTAEALNRANDALKREQLASDIEHCEEALSYEPENLQIQLVCVQLYDKNNRAQDALDLLKKVRSADVRLTSNYDLCFEEATLLTKLHRWDDALSVYDTCEPATDFSRATQLSNAAELEMIRQNPEKAVEMYEASLKLAPDNPHAHFGLTVALMRSGRSNDAKHAFMRGVTIDPNLSFLKDAFFEPKGELQFHKAVFSLFSHRKFDANFYLAHNLRYELRPQYRDLAKALKSDAESGAFGNARHKAYPIVINRVSAIAVNSTTRYIAFADDDNNSVWLLDTESGKYVERVHDCPNVKSMAFDKETGHLHVLAKTLRIDLDPEKEQGGYLYYETTSNEPRWIGFSADGTSLLGVQDNKLVSAPFNSPFQTHLIVEVPRDSNNIALLSDGHTMLIHSKQNEYLVDIESDKVLGMPANNSLVLAQAASPDRFAIGLSQSALVFAADGELLARIEGLQGQSVKDVAFDPTGQWLLTLSGTLAEIWMVEAL